MRNHLKLAALDPLLSAQEPSSNPVMPAALSAAAASVEASQNRTTTGAAGKSPNCWASLCDVNACLEAPMTPLNPTGYAVDALDDACPLLPPLPSTARLLPYENFRATTIPLKSEHLSFEVRRAFMGLALSW